MTTLHPQQEFQKLAYLEALGIQPLVLVRQPACGATLPRAVPLASKSGSATTIASAASPEAKKSHEGETSVEVGNPTASLAAVRESLMGTQNQFESRPSPKPELAAQRPRAETTSSMVVPQTSDQVVEAEDSSFSENPSASAIASASASTSPSPIGTVLPSKFTALVYAHAHVTLVAVGAQLQAQHWALSKNISLACHAANSVQSDTSALPSVLEFHWPIPGVLANEPEAAESAFAGFLSKHTAQSDTRVLLLGDLSQQLAQVFVQHAADKQILIGPSLDAMMTDQSLKRSLWQDLIANGFA
jgi:DNA polymerase III psi subunit